MKRLFTILMCVALVGVMGCVTAQNDPFIVQGGPVNPPAPPTSDTTANDSVVPGDSVSSALDYLYTNAAVAVGLFTGPGSTGSVTSVAADAGKYLRADGTWQGVSTVETDPIFTNWAATTWLNYSNDITPRVVALEGGTNDWNSAYSWYIANYLTNNTTTAFTNSVSLPSVVLTGGTGTEGIFSWNDVDGVPDVQLHNGVTGQMFLEAYIEGQNDTGSTLTNGTVATYVSAIGNSGNIRIGHTVASASEPSFMTLGVVTESIADGATGFITTRGKVRGIQTDGANYGETWVNKDILYKSSTIPGGFTTNAPQAPTPVIPIAVVISAHASDGTLLVRPTYPQSLTMLNDVNGTALTTSGQIIVWDQANGYFDFTANINQFASSANTGNWDTAFGWGDHSTNGYLTVEADPIYTNWAANGWLSHTSAAAAHHTRYTDAEVTNQIAGYGFLLEWSLLQTNEVVLVADQIDLGYGVGFLFQSSDSNLSWNADVATNALTIVQWSSDNIANTKQNLFGTSYIEDVQTGETLTPASTNLIAANTYNTHIVLEVTATTVTGDVVVIGCRVNETTGVITENYEEIIPITGAGFYQTSAKFIGKINNGVITVRVASRELANIDYDVHRTSYLDFGNRNFSIGTVRFALTPDNPNFNANLQVWQVNEDGSRVNLTPTLDFDNGDDFPIAASGVTGHAKANIDSGTISGTGNEGIVVILGGDAGPGLDAPANIRLADIILGVAVR